MRLRWGIVLWGCGLLGLAANVARGQEEPTVWERAKDLAGSAQEKMLPSSADKAPPPVMHRYVNRKGRVVYTNIEESVPLEQRRTSPIDLRDVPLHHELAHDLDALLEEQHKALMQSSYCQKIRAASHDSFLSRLWSEHSPLVIAAGVLVVLLFFSPSALRRFGTSLLSKVLLVAIPMLMVCGLMGFSTMQTNESMREIKVGASLCEGDTFAKLGLKDNPFKKRTGLMDELKRKIAQAERDLESRSRLPAQP